MDQEAGEGGTAEGGISDGAEDGPRQARAAVGAEGDRYGGASGDEPASGGRGRQRKAGDEGSGRRKGRRVAGGPLVALAADERVPVGAGAGYKIAEAIGTHLQGGRQVKASFGPSGSVRQITPPYVAGLCAPGWHAGPLTGLRG